MRPLTAFLMSASILGCASVPPPKAAALTSSPPANLRRNREVPFELPLLGVSGRAPGPMLPLELSQDAPDGQVLVIGAGCTVNSQDYSVSRYFREGRNRPNDTTVLLRTKTALKTVTRSAPLELGELRGVELEGTAPSGVSMISRTYPTGDGIWSVVVTRKEGQIDRTQALAFFDSISLTQPWSVHAFPEAHFSVLLPDGGVRIDKKTLVVRAPNVEFGEGVWIGGAADRSFLVFANTILPCSLEDRPCSAEERLNGVTQALASRGDRVLWESPVDVDGARGRDLLMVSAFGWLRMRFIVTAIHVYLLQAKANSKQAVLDESTTRFLWSFREY